MVFCKRKESLFSGSLVSISYYFVVTIILSKYCMHQLWKRENTLNTEPINLGMGALDISKAVFPNSIYPPLAAGKSPKGVYALVGISILSVSRYSIRLSIYINVSYKSLLV